MTKTPLHWIYLTTLILQAVIIVWNLVWAIPDVAIRLGLWPFEQDMGLRQLIPSIPLWQEGVFFTAIALMIAAFVQTLRHSSLALPLFLAAMLLDRLDWIILSFSPEDGHGIPGKNIRDLIVLTIEMTSLAAMGFLSVHGTLRSPKWLRDLITRLLT
ncbi:hypothetical protein [Maricaulis parjimensis]|uniref:hypothetical protein n=1 Tax=Maricaulis parjimensis TaxID=144023 RepID=UPI001939BD21|nr:hypothetical protein [Maricaulis parjimensis]